jgi:hypothetical protein
MYRFWLAVPLLTIALLSGGNAKDDYKKHPVIVAQKAFLQVTGSMTPDLFTPAEDGDFRIDIYENQQPGTGVGPTMGLIWTDEFGTQNSLGVGSEGNGVENEGGVFFVHSLAGFPIQLSILDFGVSPPTVNVRVTVERL